MDNNMSKINNNLQTNEIEGFGCICKGDIRIQYPSIFIQACKINVYAT